MIEIIHICSFIGNVLMYSTPLIFAAIGGVISERAGVVNIGIEGMMTIGAFFAAAIGHFTQNAWIGLLAAGIAGATLALVHAVAAITALADQTMSGIALNFIGPGLALFLCGYMFNGSKDSGRAPRIDMPFYDALEDSSYSPIGKSVDALVILAFLVAIIVWIFLYKTKWGLRLRSIGEHPAAADTLGINVTAMRYFAVITSGLLAGLGGAVMTLSITTAFSPTSVSGQGYIALAAVILGKWTPHGAYAACLLFGAAQAISVQLGNGNAFLSEQALSMLPYIITLIVLVFFVGKAFAPKADGIPYRKGTR